MQGLPRTPKLAARRAGPLDDLLDPALFRALGDPTRVTLVSCIAKCGRACGVGEVAECCSVDLSVVSRHLGQLARAGILEATREGRSVRYRVRSRELAARFRKLAAALSAGAGRGATECCNGS